MSDEKSLDLIRKFWPKNAPDINSVPKYINKYKKEKCRGKRSKKCRPLQRKRRTCRKIIKRKKAMAKRSRKMMKK